jgi:putative hydrolase of the HAD superfamily
MTVPRLLLFDLGGVLVENVTLERLAALGPPQEPARLKQRWLASPAVRRFEMGASSPAEFAAEFVAEWRLACAPQSFLAEFAAWPRGFYAGAAELVDELRRRHRVACLSNSNALHWRRFGGFAGHFDVALSSHLLGAVKPDRECFERALAACRVDPAEVVFFDDATANVRAAAELGARAFLVDGPAAVAAVVESECW